MLSTWLTVLLVWIFIYCMTLAEVQVGTAINVFSRYGYLSISMRVVPRNDSDRTWIFREPAVEIFSNVTNKDRYRTFIFHNLKPVHFAILLIYSISFNCRTYTYYNF